MCNNGAMMTVADLVAIPELDLRPAGDIPSDARALRWVATSELADPTPYLEGGELLLTTGLGTRGWSRQWAAYVDRLVDAGAAALGLGTGLTHDRLPDALVEACRTRGLALLEVPRATAFVAVSRAAAELLHRQEESATRHALELQRRVTHAALALDLRPLVERLARLLDASAALVHRDGTIAERTSVRRLDMALVQAEVASIRGQGLGAMSITARDGATTVVRPIGLAGRAELFLVVRVVGALDDPRRSAIDTAAVLLSLAVERRAERRSAERRLRGRALELLCGGDQRSAEVLLDLADGGGRIPERLRVLRAAGPDEAMDDALGRIEDHGPDVVAGVVDGQLVAVAPAGRVERAIELIGENTDLRIGVGRPVAADESARSAESARHALDRTTVATPVRRWEEVADAGPLALIPEAVGQEYAATLLEPLDAEQCTTLAAFLRHHGSRGAVADDLGVHRNTVRNRLADIERLTGLDLDDPSARVGAWLALELQPRSE